MVLDVYQNLLPSSHVVIFASSMALIEPRPLIVFVDGRVHLKTSQMIKDEELRTLLRKRGYRILELQYDNYTDKKRDLLYREIICSLGRE